MPSLPQTQHDFQQYVLRGETAIETHVVGTSRLSVATRLGIYGGGYGARLTEALQANFPMLAKLLGESDFATLAAEYIRSHDSTFASIRYYGAQLAVFLAREPAYAAAPILAEFARWEWAIAGIFDAADAVPVEVSVMATLAPERWAGLKLAFHPAIECMELTWNVAPIWKALSQDLEPPSLELADPPEQWLLWRRDLEVYFRSLTAAETAALDAARGGASFGEICAALSDRVTEAQAPAQAAGFLREWLQSGLITGISDITSAADV
jgi:hypothetical protein